MIISINDNTKVKHRFNLKNLRCMYMNFCDLALGLPLNILYPK